MTFLQLEETAALSRKPIAISLVLNNMSLGRLCRVMSVDGEERRELRVVGFTANCH
jgi:hypothetical protein